MTKKENALAILEGKQPDYYFDFMDAVALIKDPVTELDQANPDGMIHLDSWGTASIWLEGAPGAHPLSDEDHLVIKDIEKWKEELMIPSIENLDWKKAEDQAAQVDRNEMFLGCMSAKGLFERSHFLMGFENALIAYLENEEEMAELLQAIADYKIALIRALAEHLHPEIIFYHDDWGSKQNLLLPPRVWRKLIKPLHAGIVQTAHECGMLFMHHADCICQPIVTDMVEIGIDIWQGVIPQNDICLIQQETKGRLAMIGGIDGPKIDLETVTEHQIRAEVRRAIDAYCPGGRFFPSIPNGECYIPFNNRIYREELERYGRIWAVQHPVDNQG